jgi:hypothetical protein
MAQTVALRLGLPHGELEVEQNISDLELSIESPKRTTRLMTWKDATIDFHNPRPGGDPDGTRWLPGNFNRPPPPPPPEVNYFPGPAAVQAGLLDVEKHPDPLRQTGVPTGNCLCCNKEPIKYAADPCMHAFACKKCAMKMATGGKCKVCKEHFFELRDVSHIFKAQLPHDTRNAVLFAKQGDRVDD